MRHFFLFTLFLLTSLSFAQNPCDISANVTDSIGTYQATKPYLVYERNFGDDKSYLYLSMAITDGTPTLNFQHIRKSKSFMVAECFNSSSRLYLQLQNGKVITMVYADQGDCGTSVRSEDGYSNRILSANFYFTKGTLQDLKDSPINFIRVKYASANTNFIFKSSLKSEFDGLSYEPETYFQRLLTCLKL
ncbi:MAG: hypothetical protein ACOH1O_01170 [Flavobacterium sp.]